jgi:secondary thiamine-phosphate synthase enzyme
MSSTAPAKVAVAEEKSTKQEMRGNMKIFSRTFKVVTDGRVEFYNLTDKARELVKASGIKGGFIIISSLHTTTALFINEFQAALMADAKAFLERLANKENGYLHNCEDCSDCDRKNADSHIRAMLLGHNLTLPIQEGDILLGPWQSILFAELDGPRERMLSAQVIGV